MAIVSVFSFELIINLVLCAIEVLLLRTTQPLLLGALLDYLSNNTDYFKMEGYMIVGTLCCSWILIAIFVHPNFYISMKVALKIKVALGALIYRKVLKLSHESLNKTSVGQIINILSNDLQKFDLAIMYINYAWIVPLQLLIVGWILWIKVGKIGIIGLSVFVLFVPLQSYIGRIFAKLSLQLAFVTDERSQLMNEIITGIKVIKMHTWESPFAQVVSKIRIRNKRNEIVVFKYENTFQRQFRGVAKYFFKFHSRKDGPSVLMNINLEALQGDLFMIVGPIGSGKSSLLMAMLGELPIYDGKVKICGRIAYVPQESCVFQGSVRENILFGDKFNEKRYSNVISSCSLNKDILSFPHGDQSLIGERGILLSGGQKARLSLARAIYCDADIYILDDPFSSVDTKTGKHIFDKNIRDKDEQERGKDLLKYYYAIVFLKYLIFSCIKGILKNKVTILATHHLQYAKYATNILYMKKGIECSSEFENDFFSVNHTETSVPSPDGDETIGCLVDEADKLKLSEIRDRLVSKEESEENERREVGNINWKTYVNFLLAGGGTYGIIAVLILNILAGTLIVYLDVWLAHCLTLYGLTTIRSQNAEQNFIRKFDKLQDANSAACFVFIGTVQWISTILDTMSIILAVSTTIVCFCMSHTIAVSQIGFIISQSILVSNLVSFWIRLTTDLESAHEITLALNSCKNSSSPGLDGITYSFLKNSFSIMIRLLSFKNLMKFENTIVAEYGRLETESSEEHFENFKMSNTRPRSGEIEIQNLSLKYSEEDNYVLKNINLKIKNSEKIGIVGRTGAGKSSLITALFRLTKPEGNIFIDGISTENISLQDLRNSISVIPQDPLLFNNTVRYNMDPFSCYSDKEIWKALEQVHLKETISNLPGSLHAFVTKVGSNLSVGQRQLMCLARVLLKKNKIIVLDEATANVDFGTDALVQQTLRNLFKDCTILTIAHRLETIMESDKIMVIDSGKILEFDDPKILLQNKDSRFYKMVNKIRRR
ncbi:Multidrug resistance-associated protein 4 [Nymphon striatum]|nr:Multidrug resistance-associated protein 4 [Nymphon striatum]